MSVNGFKVPLQEQKLEMNTPFSKNNPKITTPPESSLSKNNYMVSHYGNMNIMVDENDHINTSLSIDTPIKTYDINSKNLLLSPAFSSPQSTFMNKHHHSNPTVNSYFSQINHQNYHQPSIGVSDLEKTSKKPKKSKSKKAFDFQSSDKPPYSYATLIGLSILSTSDKRLTLSSIYQWISDTFKYYKREDVGWQNSIRHNLSLNKAFIKGEKSKDGKGHFWCIQAGYEDQFLKSRSNKNGSYQEIMDQINQNSRKRSINSIPSSPNYYDANNSINSNNTMADSNEDDEDNEGNNTQIDDSQIDDNDMEFDDEFDDYSHKRQKLGEPFTNSTPKQSSMRDHQLKSVPSTNFNLLNTTPKVISSESPIKPLTASKNLTFTSSFSCNSNLELSPIRPNETGPLLEPLTPGRIYKNGAINHHLSVNYQTTNLFSNHALTTTISKPNSLISTTQPSILSNDSSISSVSSALVVNPHYGHQRTNSASRTPKRIIKTPLRILKTPQASAKKFWNSPNYLDDFYYSPLVTSNSALHSYDDDDMILRAFESPANNLKKTFEKFHDRKLSNSLAAIIDKEGKVSNDRK